MSAHKSFSGNTGRSIRVLLTALVVSFCAAARGSAGTSSLKLSPEELKFGRQQVNTPTAAQKVAVTNTGSAAVGIYQIISSGVDFKQTNDCPTSLAAAASCSVSVTFQPAIDGLREGAVIIFDSGGTAPHTIVVTGVGE
jgi:hypothetical protein